MLLDGTPLTSSTNFVDTSAPSSQANRYFVRPVIGGIEQQDSASFTLAANAPTQQYLQIPLQVPAGGTTPSGESYTYVANDLSIDDLDGDGEYEYVLKWDPTNAKDNSNSGYTANVYLDAYELNGQRLWRIDLGRNILAGARYTQFMHGGGYVNSSASGGFAEIQNVDGRGGGAKATRILYALGATGNRTGRLLVNGVAQDITFTPTGSWTTWVTMSVSVTLNNNGTNVIRFESNGQDLGNVDQIEIL